MLIHENDFDRRYFSLLLLTPDIRNSQLSTPNLLLKQLRTQVPVSTVTDDVYNDAFVDL